MTDAEVGLSTAALIISLGSFVFALVRDFRSRRAETVKNLLGEKETVAFAALKIRRKGLPRWKKERKLVIDALMQATLLEKSSRARALVYSVIKENDAKRGAEFDEAFGTLRDIVDSAKRLGLPREQLNLDTAKNRIDAVDTVFNRIRGRSIDPASE